MATLTPTEGDFHQLLESLSLCVILHDAESKDILWANRAACEALGFTVEELRPLKAPDMSSASEKYAREVGRRWLHDAVENGRSVIEWCYRSKAGVEILSEAIAILVKLEQRDVVMVQFRDIASEEKLKRDAKRFEMRLNEFMNNLSEGVTVLTADGTISFMSDSAYRLLGRSENEMDGRRFTELCDQRSCRTLLAKLSLDPPPREPYTLRFRAQRPDGSWRWFHANGRYIEIENDLTGHLLLYQDITEQVQATEAKRLNERRLEYLARYNAMGEMAVTLAHELSQPLAATRNFIEGVLMRLKALEAPTEELAWGLQNANRQVEHAAVIIRSVREYVVKLEQAEQMLDLNDIAAETQYFIDLKAAENGVQCSVQLSCVPLPVSCERILIGQVILNFAFNAIEEMFELPPEQRQLLIRTDIQNGRAILSVEDRGRGLPEELGKKIFDGFYSSKITGNGIGLALCKSIVSRHRGDIWVERAQPQGSRFCFSLPLAAPIESPCPLLKSGDEEEPNTFPLNRQPAFKASY